MSRQPRRKPLVRSVPRGFRRIAFDDRATQYEWLKRRTGCKCEQCGAQCRKPHEVASPEGPAAFIVHQDGNGANFDRPNLVLVCAACYWSDHYQPGK